ncbi:glycoside hydrolase family 43 protein [Pseudomassariella vexata]|uniref:Glycoside hydrolase family 43 protein n=1 Tax=Pseudomassariella vexata TaxID=1141098 RepID=A0A1Y2DLR8_9PEZI|nr:glycoside hydrolase family 43 protein [Pseudomassariella vexata]ORY60258.1 glycoside hydrolase family 43 protein [Pseudomassariella vexata]
MKSLFLALTASLAAGFPAGRITTPETRYAPLVGLSNITRTNFDNVKSRSFNGPFIGVDFPDPSLIWGDGSWKAYATSSNGKNVPVATSSDAVSWTLIGNDALPTLGAWVDSGDQAVWAPDVQKNENGVYVMYYTARQSGGSHCIGVATSRSDLGPFNPASTPLLCDAAGGGVIDASGYDDGTDRWIIWKVDGNSLGGATTCQSGTPSGSYRSTPIKIQRMARDATTLLDGPKTILDNQGASDDGVVEAPALYKIPNGDFILFYSTHCYSSDDYGIEYAFSSTIDGSYGNRGSLIRTVDNKGVYGPGGMDIDPNGSSVVFHGRLAAGQGSGTRELYSAAITINGHSVSY